MSASDVPDVLVGHTGFVGGNLARQRPFDLLVSSANRGDLEGGRFGHVVFSAAKAEKWRANQDPASDSAHVAELERMLGTFECRSLTLISTVDVYGSPRGVDEETVPDTEGLHAYGLHRLRLEATARRLHPGVLVARLPALFGPGLKKNVVYDLLHDNQLDRVQPRSSFQYYDLGRLADDLARAREHGIRLVNLVTEPVTTADVVARVFERPPLEPAEELPVVHYDVRTRHASTFGAEGAYLADRAAVLDALARFVRSARIPA